MFDGNDAKLLSFTTLLLLLFDQTECGAPATNIKPPPGSYVPWWGWAIIAAQTLVFLCITCKIYKCCKKCRSKQTVRCYICSQEGIPLSGWDEHRRECVDRRRPMLNELERCLTVTCNHCRNPLRKLEAGDSSDRFDCDMVLLCRNPSGHNNLKNSGGDLGRFNCFECDFDLCSKCVDFRRENDDSVVMEEYQKQMKKAGLPV